MEGSGDEGNLNCGYLTQEVIEKIFSMWPRDCSCDILTKKCGCLLPLFEKSA